MYTKKLPRDFSLISALFVAWRTVLFVAVIVAIFLIPVINHSFPYIDRILVFTKVPEWVWGFGNFDGVYYLRIARHGYIDEFVQAFFPLYPLIISLVTKINVFLPIEQGIVFPQYVEAQYFQNAMIVSNLFFLVSLFVFYKLLRLDWNKKVSFRSIVLLLIYPTAFFLGSVYSESLFFLLVVSSLYFMRQKKYLLAGILAGLSSATRITGVVMVLVLVIEIIKERKYVISQKLGKIKALISIILSSLGILSFMYFLYIKFGDALYFLNAQPHFGAQRSSTPFILLPQVIYRYLKMLITVDFGYQYMIVVAELVFTLVPMLFILLNYKKIRTSYLVLMLLSLIIPTLTGTMSSMPRYSLMAFLALPIVAEFDKKYYLITLAVFILLQVIFVSLFTRGYWIS